VYIGLHHRHHGQHLHRTRWQATCGYSHAYPCAVQCFTHMAAYKTATTQNQDIFHMPDCSGIAFAPRETTPQALNVIMQT